MPVENQTTPKVFVTMAVYKTDIHQILTNYLIFRAWNAYASIYHKIYHKFKSYPLWHGWVYVYSSPSLAVLLPVCCQITLDLLWLQNKLIGIALHQWIMMTNKTEKSKVNIHFEII